MKTRAFQLFLLVGFVTCQISVFGIQQVRNKPLSIKDAAEKRLIDYRLSGTDGSHYGDCMAIVFHNNTDSAFVLQILPGTQLVPVQHQYQTMIVTKSASFNLPANGVKSYNIFAMCGEYYDAPPDAHTIYIVDNMAKKDVVKLAQHIEFNAKQNYKGQYAMWSVTDQITNKDLEKYGATSIDINDVLRMTNEIDVPVKLTPIKVDEKEKVVESKKKSVYKREQAKVIYKNLNQSAPKVKPKEKNPSLIDKYGFGGLGVLTVLSGMAYLALRQKKKNKQRKV